MTPRSILFPVGLALLLATGLQAAKPAASDILPPDSRRAVIEKAGRLAHPAAPAPLPSEIVTPFAPPGFEQPDASESRERPAGRPGADGKAAPAAPPTDRELLAAVAARIPTTGTIILGGKPLLISGTNRIEAGSRFTVIYNGQEYELELVAIDRTTFTVRFKGEEFTRPIKQVKAP